MRVLSVPTSVEGNVLPELIKEFVHQTPYRVQLTASPRLYDLAREGKADLLVSHYGHRDAESFVLAGLGEWPRTIFSNQMALVGPPSDPARVRGLDKPGGLRATNPTGAAALQRYLLEPRTQARIRTIRYPGRNVVTWIPAGRHNRTAMLPSG